MMIMPGEGAFTIILLAVLANALLAGLPGFRQVFAAPVEFMSALARSLDARINRPQRSVANRKFRGAVAAAAMLGWHLGSGLCSTF